MNIANTTYSSQPAVQILGGGLQVMMGGNDVADFCKRSHNVRAESLERQIDLSFNLCVYVCVKCVCVKIWIE